MTMPNISMYLAVGLGAGVLAGFFGIGGGLVIVPVLVLLFGFSQHMANGTSLVALLAPVGILGVLEYYHAGKITVQNIQTGLIISLGMFAGAYIGARLSISIPEEPLRRAYCIFMVLIAIRMWWK